MARALKREVDSVVAAMEEPADSAAEAAERVIAALDEVRFGRKQYVFAVRMTGTRVAVLFGPYATSHQAIKAAERLHKGPVALEEGQGVYGLVNHLTLAELDVDPRKCPDCGHPAAAHGWPKSMTAGCTVSVNRTGFTEGARKAGKLAVCPCERSKF